jgi:hypothetical protein
MAYETSIPNGWGEVCAWYFVKSLFKFYVFNRKLRSVLRNHAKFRIVLFS